MVLEISLRQSVFESSLKIVAKCYVPFTDSGSTSQTRA